MARIFQITNTSITPYGNELLDLGSFTLNWKDLYVGGVSYLGSLEMSGPIDLSDNNITSVAKISGLDGNIYLDLGVDGTLVAYADTALDITSTAITLTGACSIVGDTDINDNDLTSVGFIYGLDNFIYVDMSVDGTISLSSDILIDISSANITTSGTISSAGDLIFVGAFGIPYGSMYTNTTVVTELTDSAIWYQLEGESGGTIWTEGLLNLCTYADSAITVTLAGVYEVSWSLSTDFSEAPGASQEITYAIMVDGVEANDGRVSRTLDNSTDRGACSGVALLDLPANSVISLAARNDTDSGKILHVEHGNMTVKMVGGT